MGSSQYVERKHPQSPLTIWSSVISSQYWGAHIYWGPNGGCGCYCWFDRVLPIIFGTPGFIMTIRAAPQLGKKIRKKISWHQRTSLTWRYSGRNNVSVGISHMDPTKRALEPHLEAQGDAGPRDASRRVEGSQGFLMLFVWYSFGLCHYYEWLLKLLKLWAWKTPRYPNILKIPVGWTWRVAISARILIVDSMSPGGSGMTWSNPTPSNKRSSSSHGCV